jgi:hypothetical protein
MKSNLTKYLPFIVFFLILGMSTSCKTTIHPKAKSIPPGQIKKEGKNIISLR